MLYLLLLALPALAEVDAGCFTTDGMMYGIKKG